MDETSWESSSSWYDKIVGAEGHYYHKSVILPGVLKLLKLESDSSLLDLACGQGVLARQLPKQVRYVGIDASKTLIDQAKARASGQTFEVHDLSLPLDLRVKTFSHATCILALQNLADPALLVQSAFTHLRNGGCFVVVINHPNFRVPRQSSWGIDAPKKLQYRRVDTYMSSLKIPIQTHPGKAGSSTTTWSFHHPLSFFISLVCKQGFVLSGLEEWCSDKQSTGSAAAMENRARKEFPLFMALVAKKP